MQLAKQKNYPAPGFRLPELGCKEWLKICICNLFIPEPWMVLFSSQTKNNDIDGIVNAFILLASYAHTQWLWVLNP